MIGIATIINLVQFSACVDYEVPSFQGDYGRLVQTITDIIEQELVISQDNFSFVMETCEKMEVSP